MKQMCFISTFSLKYTYLRMNLWSGEKIRRGLPKRELVKKHQQTCQQLAERVSREQANVSCLQTFTFFQKLCNHLNYYYYWLVGTKPSHNPRHFRELKITFQNPKHFPESKNTWFWEVFSILGFWHIFLDSGKYFGFWKVFSRWAQIKAIPQMSY